MPTSVPKLDLSPKLNRPLYLWNPFDYLLLLYWVFFFPQALRWYEEKWRSGKKLSDYKTWGEKWQFLQQHPQQLQLWIQGILLTLTVPFAMAKALELLGVNIYWFGVAVGVAVGVAF